MSDHLTEEEQLEAFKRWWKENGKWIVAAIVIAAGGYFGWTSYQTQQQESAEAGSALYTELLDTLAVDEGEAISDENRARAVELSEQLKADYSDSAYGVNAALLHARWAVDEGDLEAAAGELRWVLDQEPEAAVAQLTRLRLARVLAGQGELDGALSVLDEASPAQSLVSQYAEARGDVLAARGDNDAAADAYQSAMESLDAQQQNRYRLLQMKLDNVRPVDVSNAPATEENAS